MTPELGQIAAAHAEQRQAEASATFFRRRVRELAQAAIAERYRPTEIAEALGISRQRVNTILNGR
jgi:DNA-binding transcriptional regulator LsrR (DeoR family)